MIRIILLSIFLVSCGTTPKLSRSGGYDSGPPCTNYAIYDVDNIVETPRNIICIEHDLTDKLILSNLHKRGYILQTHNYRLERDDADIWLFENTDPRIILVKLI